jgi:CHASE2 domain-containing sensor protein
MQRRSRRWFSLYLGGMMLIVGASCWLLMWIGGWIPFIPTVSGIFVGGVLANTYRKILSSKSLAKSLTAQSES